MNRREFLIQLQNFCLAYGIQGILSQNSFASGSPSRLINFVIKYTGGATDENGVGQWKTDGVLSPLSRFSGEMAIPLGLHSGFKAPMNSHAAPQVSSLSGSMTGFVLRETYYPVGNLQNFSTGEGKSIDLLIGEKLQKTYSAALPLLAIGNDNAGEAATQRTSSWGKNGEIFNSLTTVEGLRAEISSRARCEKFSRQTYATRAKALDLIKKNQKIFSSQFLINKERFELMEQQSDKNLQKTNLNLSEIDRRGPRNCHDLESRTEISGSVQDRVAFEKKMEQMYDLGIIALQDNITRVITFNLHLGEAHHRSHFDSQTVGLYYDVCRFYQSSISAFLAKLEAAGLYQDTLVFCNAGSCTRGQLHNYENLSTYILNGGVSGVRGSAAELKPIGSLLLDILNKFEFNYTEYGGSDHNLGVGKKGNFV